MLHRGVVLWSFQQHTYIGALSTFGNQVIKRNKYAMLQAGELCLLLSVGSSSSIWSSKPSSCSTPTLELGIGASIVRIWYSKINQNTFGYQVYTSMPCYKLGNDVCYLSCDAVTKLIWAELFCERSASHEAGILSADTYDFLASLAAQWTNSSGQPHLMLSLAALPADPNSSSQSHLMLSLGLLGEPKKSLNFFKDHF